MPYEGIGPYPVGSLEDMIDSAIRAGQDAHIATPQEQAALASEQATAYAQLQAADFSESIMPKQGIADTFAQWLQRNQTPVFIGVGALVLMSVFKGRR